MQVTVGQSGQVFHAENVVRVQLDNLLLGDARPFLEGITGVRRLAAQTLSSHASYDVHDRNGSLAAAAIPVAWQQGRNHFEVIYRGFFPHFLNRR